MDCSTGSALVPATPFYVKQPHDHMGMLHRPAWLLAFCIMVIGVSLSVVVRLIDDGDLMIDFMRGVLYSTFASLVMAHVALRWTK